MINRSTISTFVFLLFIVTVSINNFSFININDSYIFIYESWFKLISVFFRLFKFSVGDILYIIIPIIIIIYFFKIERRRDKLIYLFKVPIIIYCFFYWSWGFNYNKKSNFEQLKTKKYSVEDLYVTVEYYIEETNNLNIKISKKKENKVQSSYSFNDLKNKCVSSITNEEWLYQNKKINNFPVKKSIFSNPLSYMGFTGYINPFTLEANINYNIPKISIPVTICHEIAHQIGYAFEDEANYIAIKALSNSNDNFLRYSGNLMAVQYLLSEIRKNDIEKHDGYIKELNTGVIKNIQDKNEYYLKYKSKYKDFFKKNYDAFLKSNNQKAGIKTYSLVVDLLINEYQSKI
jgi:hypothetical protein